MLKLLVDSVFFILTTGGICYAALAALAAVLHDAVLPCISWTLMTVLLYQAANGWLDAIYRDWCMYRIWRR